MKDCRDVEPLKAPYVDGEAAPAERSAVESHISACGRCRDDVTVERAARDVLVARRDELRASAPDSLKTRCASYAGAARQGATAPGRDVATFAPKKAPIYRRWVPMSLAATLFLAVTGVFAFGLTQKSQALAFQMTLDHLACLRFGNQPATADATTVEQRWTGTQGWPLRVAASSEDPPVRLRGVRRCAVTDGRVAHLMYEWEGRPLSVYVLPSDAVRGEAEVRRFGHDAVMWTGNGRTYVVLARSPKGDDLAGVVRYMKANVH